MATQAMRRLRRMVGAMKHPEWLRYGNLALAFLLELAALLSFAAIGVLLSGWLQLVGGLVGAAVFIVLWGIYAAPRSKRRLRRQPLLIFKVAIFAVASLILVLIGLPLWGILLAVLAALNLLVAEVLKQY